MVQVGEPIQLSFRVRGDGDLTTASLPPLDAGGLLDPEHFRVPDEPPVGRSEEDGKHFGSEKPLHASAMLPEEDGAQFRIEKSPHASAMPEEDGKHVSSEKSAHAKAMLEEDGKYVSFEKHASAMI